MSAGTALSNQQMQPKCKSVQMCLNVYGIIAAQNGMVQSYNFINVCLTIVWSCRWQNGVKSSAGSRYLNEYNEPFPFSCILYKMAQSQIKCHAWCKFDTMDYVEYLAILVDKMVM